MENIKDFDKFNESNDYTNPESFEHVDGIDVSLTEMRKKVRIAIGESSIELSKAQAEEILSALTKAIGRM